MFTDQLRQLFQQGLKEIGLSLDQTQSQQFEYFFALLIKWNKAYNLTAIRDPEEILIKHFLDSASIAPWIQGQRVLDVGTGAGFPGIPLAILKPEQHFDLLDTNGKKTRFLLQVKQALNLTRLNLIHARVEAFKPEQCYDQITTRAFSSLEQMLEVTGHLCCNNGQFVAMKGAYPEEELKNLPQGYKVEDVVRLKVPFLEAERCLVLLRG